MDKTLKKIIFGLILLSLCLLLAGLVVFKAFFPAHYFWFFPVLILIFLIVNTIFFISFYKSLKKSHNQFIRNFMASTGIKLMIYFFVVLAYVLTSPKTAIPFAISLSITYIAYTAYDLLVMLFLIKHRKENADLSGQLSN